MNILLFGPDKGKRKQKLETLILSRLHDVNVRLADSRSHLLDIFSRPLNGIDVLVALIATPQDINVLYTLNTILNDIRLILVLCGHSPKILESGLKLSPSFISYHENDLMDIISMIKKMREKRNGNLWPNIVSTPNFKPHQI